MSDFDLSSLETSNGGLDAFLGENPSVITPLECQPRAASIQGTPPTPPRRMKVASLEQLSGFIRTAEDMLVRKSERDLWSLRKDGNGDFYVERLFDETGAPLKG